MQSEELFCVAEVLTGPSEPPLQNRGKHLASKKRARTEENIMPALWAYPDSVTEMHLLKKNR